MVHFHKTSSPAEVFDVGGAGFGPGRRLCGDHTQLKVYNYCEKNRGKEGIGMDGVYTCKKYGSEKVEKKEINRCSKV